MIDEGYVCDWCDVQGRCVFGQCYTYNTTGVEARDCGCICHSKLWDSLRGKKK